jgi:ABC-type Fe3+ transport system substrate-binding protein
MRMKERWFPLLFGCLLFFPGCARKADEARPLTIISPHRDEIREETARAFSAWFAERSQERKQAAVAALTALIADDTPEHRASATEAIDALLADWDDGEAVTVREARERWDKESSGDNAKTLADALAAWEPPPVVVVWQDIGGGTSQILKYVRSSLDDETRPGQIDLLFGGGTDIYLRLVSEGKYLQKIDIPPALLARIPPELNGFPLYDPQHRWFGPMLSGFGILSNRTVLERIGEPVPQRWADLGRPGLRGWVGTGDPRLTGAVHMVLEIILQGQGWENGARLLLRLGANTHAFTRDSGTLTRDVVLGQVAAAGSIDVLSLGAVARNPDMMRFDLPAGETVINPDAIGVLVRGPRPRLARAFVEFTLSNAGQRLFCLQPGQPGGPKRYPLCRLSVLPSLYEEFPPETRSTGDVNPFAIKNAVNYDGKLGGRRWDALNDLFGAWVVDAHPDLRNAWAAVCALPEGSAERSRLEAELFEPPCTEAELSGYAATLAEGDPRVRTVTVTRWGEQARERYRRVRYAARGR